MLKGARHGQLMPHGAAHYVMEVHDVGGFIKPFEPGVVLTVEPGVYDEKTGIGIRIEDVVPGHRGYEVLRASRRTGSRSRP